jgi:hypothetical protein
MKHISPTLCLVAGIVIRSVVFGASIGDAIALCAVCGLHGYLQYLNSVKTIPINDSVRAELAEIKSTVNALKIAKSMGR